MKLKKILLLPILAALLVLSGCVAPSDSDQNQSQSSENSEVSKPDRGVDSTTHSPSNAPVETTSTPSSGDEDSQNGNSQPEQSNSDAPKEPAAGNPSNAPVETTPTPSSGDEDSQDGDSQPEQSNSDAPKEPAAGNPSNAPVETTPTPSSGDEDSQDGDSQPAQSNSDAPKEPAAGNPSNAPVETTPTPSSGDEDSQDGDSQPDQSNSAAPKEPAAGNPSNTTPADPNEVTIKFELNNDDDDSIAPVSSIKVKVGDLASLPSYLTMKSKCDRFTYWGDVPEAIGATWLTTHQLDEKFVKEHAKNGVITLYAQWYKDATRCAEVPEFAGQTKWVAGVVPPKPEDWVSKVALGDGITIRYIPTRKSGAQSGWYDVDQFKYDLCWAASTSNIIYWWINQNKDYIARYRKGFPNKKIPNYVYRSNLDNDVFNEVIDVMKNAGNQPRVAFSWFILGNDSGLKPGVDREKYPGGYFADVFNHGIGVELIQTLIHRIRIREFNKLIAKAMHNGDALAITWNGSLNGHEITLWGAHFDDKGLIDKIYITNSNDGFVGSATDEGLIELPIKYDKNGYIFTNNSQNQFTIAINAIIRFSAGKQYWEEFLKKHNL